VPSTFLVCLAYNERLNRDSKNITALEYELFYQSTFLDVNAKPLAWNHFSGDVGSGISFRALLYIPAKLPDDFWQGAQTALYKGIRLMVKRTFITSDFGEDYLPKWASWVKAIIDGTEVSASLLGASCADYIVSADDLPLNVSRETLQNASFLRQIKQAILKRIIQTFSRLSEEEPEKFAEAQKVYGTAFKLGVIEDSKNSDKLALLVRFATNQRNSTSLDEVCSSRNLMSRLANNHSQYIENKKAGQKQIFYVSDAGKSVSSLAKSVFVEKLHARGYEVLLLTDSIDEILLHHLRKWKWVLL
jgi:heat shock protein 90kDa beta